MAFVRTTENTHFQSVYEFHEFSIQVTNYSKIFDLTPTKLSNYFRLVNNVVLGAFISLFGISSNIINMIVFHRQGFTTTANISFFALALSDVMCLLTYEGFNMCVNPLWDRIPFPYVAIELQYITTGWPHVGFGRVTSWITVYITAERCLSVALPLKIKQIVSPRKTLVTMCAIFAINLFMLSPEYYIAYYGWKFVPHRNVSLIGIVYRNGRKETDGLIYTLTSISGMLSFIAVIILTTFLTIKLTQTSNWHSKVATNSAQTESRSMRDKRTMKMVIMIATILIICYTPGTIVSLVTVFEPELVPSARYHNYYFDAWSFAFLTGSINSSVNMLLYYNMSTKYRETFNQLFANCMKSIKHK